MDKNFKLEIRTALAAKPRRFVTEADVAAIACRESNAIPVFRKTDTLYSANVDAARNITGLSPEVINQTITIVSGPLRGQFSKFRCESAYWIWATRFQISDAEKFLLSCSFGVGQKMMRWLIADTNSNFWQQTIQIFMGSVPTQLLHIADDIDSLLVGTEGDRPLAFTRYNAGLEANESSLAYKTYGVEVARMATEYAMGTDCC